MIRRTAEDSNFAHGQGRPLPPRTLPHPRTLVETAQMIFVEPVILKLRPLFHESSETMRARHTNLE
jgi:hypothetical protein